MENLELNWLNRSKAYKKCPHCKEGELDIRIRRGKLVKLLLFWLALKRYECSKCGYKAYILDHKMS